MAAELVVPSTARTNRPLSIAATGFEADGTLVVSVDEVGLRTSYTLDASGDLVGEPLQWTPLRDGKYTVRASDGTDSLTAYVQVYSTT